MQEYPKILYLKGWEDLSESKVVFNEEEEKQSRENGYKSLNEEPKKRGRKVAHE